MDRYAGMWDVQPGGGHGTTASFYPMSNGLECREHL
jgi:hypothetical protein